MELLRLAVVMHAVLDSKAVELIDSGCDPPVTVVLSF